MKKITLTEFAELAKNDETLKQKMISEAKHFDGGQPDALKNLAAEYGYELEPELPEDPESLSDDELDNVAGGKPIHKWFYHILLDIFGMEDEYD